MEKKNILVTYFSASGTTAQIAWVISETLGADMIEIKPVQPYTRADLNWNDKSSRSSVEMNDKGSRPAITNHIDDFERYDTVFVGFPIWWYTAPTIIATFLESYDFADKTIIPFATSGGSGMGKIVDDLKLLVSRNAKWMQGKRIGSKQEVAAWLESLNL